MNEVAKTVLYEMTVIEMIFGLIEKRYAVNTIKKLSMDVRHNMICVLLRLLGYGEYILNVPDAEGNAILVNRVGTADPENDLNARRCSVSLLENVVKYTRELLSDSTDNYLLFLNILEQHVSLGSLCFLITVSRSKSRHQHS